MFKMKTVNKIILVTSMLALSACGAAGRIADIGKAPDMTPIKDVKAPPAQRSISVPMPSQNNHKIQTASLWRGSAEGLYKDGRARRVGDLLTVNINITDSAKIGNTTNKSRATSEGAGVANFFGLEAALPYAFTKNENPGTVDSAIQNAYDPSKMVGADSGSSYTGDGSVNRSEAINLTLAAIVSDVLPNGNLVIQGRQEVRVNFEKRELLIAGIVRPEDISSGNTIQHTQIAEARIIYGGKGQLTDVQQPRYGAQLYDIIFPF